MSNAHENIDNEILLNTLNRIMQGSSGNWMEGLYEAQTKGGDTRYIHRKMPRLGTKEAFNDMTINLIRQIQDNPAYGDTLTAKTLPIAKESVKSLSAPDFIDKILYKLFGIGR